MSQPGCLHLSFDYTFGAGPEAEVHFAYFYPFSYADCQRLLRNIDNAFGSSADPAAPPGRLRGKGKKGSKGRDPAADVYYHRELLAHSLEGRRVELLTITSTDGRSADSDREPRIEGGLFPEERPRPHRFAGKPAVFVSARVHPGETAASYMLHGFLAFLLQPGNSYARELRRRFVFKVVPMVNPDGVFHGHFRTDTRGCNLNRQYATPSPSRHPTIFAIKNVLKQLSSTFPSLPGEPSPGAGSSTRSGHGGLWCYLDLHGYSARHGCYFIANPQTPHREWRSLFLASAMQTYAPQFNADACGYGKSKKGLPSKRSIYGTPYGQLHDRSITRGGGERGGAAGGGAVSSSKSGGSASFPASSAVAAASSSAGGRRSAQAAEGGDADDDDDEDGAAGSGDDSELDEGRAARGERPLSLEDLAVAGELYAPGAAGLVDPTEEDRPLLAPFATHGDPAGRLAAGERSRVSREWAQVKSKSSGKGEGHKDGTGRVCALRELGVQLSFTIECSCNMLSHTRVYGRLHAAAHLRSPGFDPYAAHHVQAPADAGGELGAT